MRPLLIIGIALIALGAFVFFRGGASFTHRDDVVKVGDLKVTANKKEFLPPWTGALAIVGGIACMAAGSRRRVGI